MCFLITLLSAEAYPQPAISQVYGRSPVCMRMCTTSLLALGALYPHPATAHSLAPGMRAALSSAAKREAAYLPKGHKCLTSFKLRYTTRPPRS